MWNKELNHLCAPIPDGGNRIQGIEIQESERPIIRLSVYMPCKGNPSSIEEFIDCIDQLREIVEKYHTTHQIIIGGDFNEERHTSTSTARIKHLNSLVDDYRLRVTEFGSTFIHPNGKDSSAIDYFLTSANVEIATERTRKLDLLSGNVSDHYPIQIEIAIQLSCAKLKDTQNSPCDTKPNWKKVDIDLYRAYCQEIGEDEETDSNITLYDIEKVAISTCHKMKEAAIQAGPKRKKRPKMTVWCEEIAQCMKRNKTALWKWKEHGRPSDPENILVKEKKNSKKELRRAIRIEKARMRNDKMEKLMEARTSDSKLFHKIIKDQRKTSGTSISELTVQDIVYKDEAVPTGWRNHFSALGSITHSDDFDDEHLETVKHELDCIIDICEKSPALLVTPKLVSDAVKQLNTGKSPDVYGITAEHIINANRNIVDTITEVINKILIKGSIPKKLKVGTITPVFKKKGNIKDSKSYRGITVTPVILKIIENLLKGRIHPYITQTQNVLQRGFTADTSPLHCALIVEEFIRESKDNDLPAYIAYLDAKTAFDVVSHQLMLQKLFHIGIDGSTWMLIHSLYTDATSAVKWRGELTESFQIEQGVRQGGIISADLYKVYINDMLDILDGVGDERHIGHIRCTAPTCADDVALLSNNPQDLQLLINTATNYSIINRYILQPTKSVVMEIPNKKRSNEQSEQWDMNGKEMPVVDTTKHIGVTRAVAKQQTISVDENIVKARRTFYSLMGTGLHGENGLYPETSIHLFLTYILPVLLYSLEIILPSNRSLDKAELFLKKCIKHILSIPKTTPDSAVYILSGLLPVEAIIHRRALCLFGSIARSSETSVEKQIARRQLAVKSTGSNSWFTEIVQLLARYDLPDALSVLNNSCITKEQWKSKVSKHVNSHWKLKICQTAELYSALQYMNTDIFKPGKCHPLVKSTNYNPRDVKRLAVKLKIVTGTYMLQTNRAAYNQNRVDTTCQLCHNGDEDLLHFLLDCETLEEARHSARDEIEQLLRKNKLVTYIPDCGNIQRNTLLQCILDASKLQSGWEHPLI